MSKASWMKNIFRATGIVVGLLAGCVGVRAQQPAKTWKIGVLVSSTQAVNAPRDEALRQGLHDLGYEEGKNIAMEYRYAEGKTDRLDKLARELVEQKVDVIVVGGTGVAVAAKNATSTIPIVVAGAGDLVEAGLIKSFMFPGGNVTGVARMSADFFGARLKLIKEILPKTFSSSRPFKSKESRPWSQPQRCRTGCPFYGPNLPIGDGSKRQRIGRRRCRRQEWQRCFVHHDGCSVQQSSRADCPSIDQKPAAISL